MEEAFPFSPLPLNPGNAASTEPITAERMAGSVAGLSKELGWVAKRGTFSWQGGSFQQRWYGEATSSIRAEPCTQEKPLEKQPAHGEQENTAAKETKAPQVT